MAYDLSDPLVFIGSGVGNSFLQGFQAPAKDIARPTNNSFVPDGRIRIASPGSAAQAPYSELKVFNGTIKGASLDSLIQDLRRQNLRVNRDGYCYIFIAGSSTPSPRIPSRFLRLNDLFPWKDYVDDPTNYNTTPSSTIWNRRNSGNSTVKEVDYEKLDADLKKANNDNAVLIKENNDLKTQVNAGNNDEIDDLKTQVKDLNAVIDTITNNWHASANIGARPLPPNTFNVIKVTRPDARFTGTDIYYWIGKYGNLISAPAIADFNTIKPGSVTLYYSTSIPFEFDPNFWWVVKMDLISPSKEAFNYMVIYYDGRHILGDDAQRFRYFSGIRAGIQNGHLNLDRLGKKFCFVIPTAR